MITNVFYVLLFVVLANGNVCEPGSVRQSGCKICRCNPDGTSESCNTNQCPVLARYGRDVPEHCEPNSTFKKDCNHCICSPDGTSALCTLKGCLSPQTAGQETKSSSVVA